MGETIRMIDPPALLQSPLHTAHLRLGGKLVPFAGWKMPVQFSGITAEHLAVRRAVGMFDISHMGQVLVSGAQACAALDGLLTNRVAKLTPGQGHYTLMLNERGGVIDDLILYQLAKETYFLVVNASMIAEDVRWIEQHLSSGVKLENSSAEYAGIAVQGPLAGAVHQAWEKELGPLPLHNGVHQRGHKMLCRTGYTGEDGWEFFCPRAEAEMWWERFRQAGALPCGLGARDTLRLECGFPLNGQDLSPARTPLEAGLGFFVDLTKDFLGSTALQQQQAAGVPSKLCGLRLQGKGPPLRAHYPLWQGHQALGEISSGGLSPSLGASIGLAYLPTAAATLACVHEVAIRGTRYPVEVVKKSFYKRPPIASTLT